MQEQIQKQKIEQLRDYERKLNLRERTHCKIPNSNISIIASILGNVSPDNLRDVIKKMQVRHPILNTHMEIRDKDVYLIGDYTMEIPLKVIPREDDEHWNRTIIEEQKIPLKIDEGPLIRFILLRSPELSDLIIFCQHTICDGMSLAYLARDIMDYLGNPLKEVETMPIAPIVDEHIIPKEIKPSLALRLFANTIKKKWEKSEVIFDFQDFFEVHKVYWKNYTYKAELYELSKADTKTFVEACRRHDVTVNSALIAAFSIAQNKTNPSSPKYLKGYASAANLRSYLSKPVGEQFGFFAGGIQFKYKHKKKYSFWETAKKIHELANPEKTREQALIGTLNNFLLPAPLMEAQFFAAFGHLVPPSSPRYPKMQAFLNDEKNIAVKMVKKKLSTGTQLAQIMTNLGNLNFPEKYGNSSRSSDPWGCFKHNVKPYGEYN